MRVSAATITSTASPLPASSPNDAVVAQHPFVQWVLLDVPRRQRVHGRDDIGELRHDDESDDVTQAQPDSAS